MGESMIKKVVIFLLGMMAVCSTVAFAGGLDMMLYCPASVASGAALNVTVKVSNSGSSSVFLNRYAAGIVGNYGDVLSTARVYGPYAKTISTRTVPVGGGVVSFAIPVVSSVSADLKGKMALVVVNFINNNGQSIVGNSCMVNVP
jgi:hypothetical protein